MVWHTPSEVGNVCTVGDGFDVDISEIEAADYECEECGNKFKAVGKDVKCPSCRTRNVKKLE